MTIKINNNDDDSNNNNNNDDDVIINKIREEEAKSKHLKIENEDSNGFVKNNFLYFAVAIITIGTLVNAIFGINQFYGFQNQEFIKDQNFEAIELAKALLVKERVNDEKATQLLNRVIYEVQDKDAKELIEQNFINAFVSYQNRIMLKEFANLSGIKGLEDTPLLNKTFVDYPRYEANETHIMITYDNNGNTTAIDIPEPLRNLIHPFKSAVSDDPKELENDTQMIKQRPLNETTKK